MKAVKSFIFLSILIIRAAVAQTLHLDLQPGYGYNYAEGAHFGKGTHPLKAHYFQGHVFAAPLLRFSNAHGWSFSLGYKGGELGWGYRIKMPSTLTHNPFHGESASHSAGAYIHQIPLLAGRTIAKYSFVEFDTIQHLYLISFKLEALFGGGINRRGTNCLDCGSLSSGSGLYDTITFTERPRYLKPWGGFLMAGLTARFYRMGHERFHVTLFLQQGLTNMLEVPVDYTYNSRRGAITLFSRGSGIGLMAGYPLLLYSGRSRRGMAVRR